MTEPVQIIEIALHEGKSKISVLEYLSLMLGYYEVLLESHVSC
jgi:hypothetical protein